MSNATFTFGRFNPPTEEGHGKLVSAVQQHAEKTGGQHYIFPTHTQDKKKNPMSHDDKVGAMHKLFPSAHVVSHPDIRTAIHAVKHLEDKGHTHVTMVVGSDRVDEFHHMLNKYRDKEFPKVKKISVVSAGHRDPDAEGAEGMSASKLRGLVSAGKKKEFVSHYSDPKLGAKIHDQVKAGMQMESTNPVGIFLLGGPGSGKDYVLNNIFSRFDLTEVQVDQLINGAAAELVEQKKNIVINGAIDAEKMAIVSSILEGYNLDSVFVSVTNKVSRLRNSLRDNPLVENRRIEKFLAAERLAESIENAFVFNNSINLNESSDMEKVFFGSQIEKLLARLIEHGLEIKETPEPKSFVAIKEKYSHSPAQQAAIAIAMKKAGKKPMKEDIRYAEVTQFPPMESLRLHAERIAEKHGVSPAEILDHLASGISVEFVKTRNYKKATEIALKNLEKQSDYYSKATTVEEQLKRPKVPAMRYVPSEAERVKASQQNARQHRVIHRWLDHKNADVHSIAKEEKEVKKLNPVAVDMGAKAALRQPTSVTGVQTDTLSEKTFPPVKHDKSGLPKKYVAGLTPGEIKAKKAAISHNAKLSDSNPEAYKDMPGDKRVRAKGIPLSKYTKKYHAMYGEEVEQVNEMDKSQPASSRGAEGLATGSKATPTTVKKTTSAALVTLDQAYAKGRFGNAPKGSKTLKTMSDIRLANKLTKEEVEQVEEGAADSSLAAKAAKSGISVGTLRKVYNRGVAAWNSGHRPGTTPQQWGHARVNSYITKGKTYHTADKDLHENVDVLFERQFDGTDSYREYAIAMTPGQSQEIKDAQGNTQSTEKQKQCGCGGGCDCNSISDSPTGASGNRIARSLKQIKTEAKEVKEKEGDINVCYSEPHEYWGSVESWLTTGYNLSINEHAQPEGPKSGKSVRALVFGK